MLDVSLLREEPDRLRSALARRALDVELSELIELDEQRRQVRSEAETIRAEQRALGKEIARMEGEAKQAAIERASGLADRYKELIAQADELDVAFQERWVRLPNLPDDSVPDGEGEEDNLELKRWGDPRSDVPADHQDLGEGLGIIDVERAAKVSGTRFGYLLGEAVTLELGLVRWAMDHLVTEGFTPVIPPVLVREQALFGTGFFPADREQVYAIPEDDLFLVGTSEVPLAAMHLDEIFDGPEVLPIRYAGFSTCFRREAGTYGRDTRGIFRVHQFDKVEMFSFSHPDRSWEEHDYLLSLEERLVQELEIPYRVVNVCTGDLGASAAKKFDIEAWFPSESTYREITSCSNTTDYQARRLQVRFRDQDENRLVHTLNGTAVGVGRTILALLENHQRPDGSVRIPETLRPYTGFEEIPSGQR